MKVTVYFTPLGVNPQDVAGRPVIVLDLLRTTTTIVAALARGARAVLPASGPDDALRLAGNLERDTVLLAGERRLQPIDGFNLGNSPSEMMSEVVVGKTIVMATTNGTPALMAAEPGNPVLIGAATNFSAVVERARCLFAERGEIVILCGGRQRMFALEDAYAAGRFVDALVPGKDRRKADFNDAAIASLELVRRYGDRWKRAIAASAAARDLKANGLKADLNAATEVDTQTIVPVYANRLVTVPS
ncbi:MAG TPA: 2-phosphosulfolactate phosphatase [Gemmatimonadales bacterium]|jgi:2-phosphosulfolactate phosphatase